MFFNSSSSPDTLSPSVIRKDNQSLSPEKYLQRFHELLQEKPVNETKIINYLLKTPDVLMLINLSLQDESLAAWCEDEQMTHFWDEIWRRADRNPTFAEAAQNPSLIYRGLRPQQNISSYRLVCGLTLFSSAEQLVDKGYPKNSETVVSLLTRASELGSYDALNTLTEINIEKLANHEIEIPEMILTPLLKATPWHGTPLYLLCAFAHFCIANYYARQKNLRESQQAYQSSLINLYAAAFCETASEDEIYNAYNLAGIKASNIWDIDDIDQLIEKLIIESGLDLISISRARSSADSLAQKYLSLRQINTSLSIVM